MHYFIILDNKLTEVSAEQYEIWHEFNSEKYLFPDREIQIGDYVHSIETMFNGAVDKGEGIYPFILIYFKDILNLNLDGIKRKYTTDEIEYFETYDQLKTAYHNLVTKLEEESLK